ncbi:hypothetical protein C8Q78DRAFT_971846, partial [Trametes maxima]
MDLDRDRGGRLHFSSVDIPELSLDEFTDVLKDNLAEHPRLSNSLFMLELRGTKGMYSFPFEIEDLRQDAFNRLVEQIDLAGAEQDNLQNWHCDVGLEIAQPGYVLQWLTHAHHRLLSHALPSQDEDNITRLLNGSAFSEDLSGHLYDLAGFRIAPGARGRPDGVAYINVYTTDKEVTYQLHTGAFSPHRVSALYPGPFPRLLADMETIAKMFAECGGVHGQTQDGTARFEIRVKISEAMETLNSFPNDLLINSCIAIPNTIWWDFKYCRVAAINYVLKEFAQDDPRSRAELASIQLGAVLIHMLNAVISRPGDWSAESSVAQASTM